MADESGGPEILPPLPSMAEERRKIVNEYLDNLEPEPMGMFPFIGPLDMTDPLDHFGE